MSNGFKENHVSNDLAPQKIPEEALTAFLDGILTELKAPSDPDMLTQVRAIFRKRIPLHLRSYAAALMILRAAGISRQPVPKSYPSAQKPEPQKSESQKAESPSVEFHSPSGAAMAPLFVSMGKRQRLRPQELRALISEKTGILSSDLGRVHLFDNYSFIDIPESEATRIIEAVNGATIHGKALEIKPARKRPTPTKANDGDDTN